jgi:hypothetical protein
MAVKDRTDIGLEYFGLDQETSPPDEFTYRCET